MGMSFKATLLALSMVAAPAFADQDAVAEAVQGYMDFATYEQGIILPQQIDADVFAAAVLSTRAMRSSLRRVISRALSTSSGVRCLRVLKSCPRRAW